ncbi:hypothetical protein ACFVIM_15720 [Streptomyces sp. NPDC057638]|uniref:SCO2584 family spore wall biosynthesis protein n=1 Tax=Streptomyces sp. NPDC057638 TaxID=3346190 RepID=UPI0036932E81
MPDDVGGRPFPDGWEPDDDRGGADEDFASVVFDEDFVRSAPVHEPTAVERLLAAAKARAEAEAARAGSARGPHDDDLDEGFGPYGRAHDEDDDLLDNELSPYGRHGGALRPYRNSARWHRPVAWILAVVMGIGMVALAFTAVYRGAAGHRQDQIPSPATSGVDATSPASSTEGAAPPLSGRGLDRVGAPYASGTRQASVASARPGTP